MNNEVAKWAVVPLDKHLPPEMKLEVAEDSPAGQKGATHAGHQLPMVKVSRIIGLWDMVGLLDELTVHLIAEGPEIMAGLQDTLDNRDGVRHSLNLLKGIEDLHGFILEAAVTLLLLH